MRRQGGARECVIVIHPGALGDLIQALPAFERLRAGVPDARLVHVVGSPLDAISREWKLFDDILAFDAEIAYHGSAAARLRAIARLTRQMRGMRPSRAAVFKAAPAYALLARLSGAAQRVGLTRGAGVHLLTSPILIEAHQHRQDRFDAVVSALGIGSLAGREACWPVDASDAPTLPERERLIVFAPGGGRNSKAEMPCRRWPAESYAALAAALAQRVPNAHIVLLGAGDDRLEADRVMASAPGTRITSLVGRLSVFQCRALIARSLLFVGNDSALLHLAATTATPTVAVFGPTDPRVACPRRGTVLPVWRPAHAEPCHDDALGTLQPCVHPCCIDRVTVDDVLDAALALLQPAAPDERTASRAPASHDSRQSMTRRHLDGSSHS